MNNDINVDPAKNDGFLDVFPLLDNSQENCTYKSKIRSMVPWTPSQRNCFIRVKSGIKAHDGKILRFLTLTSAPLMLRSINQVFRCMQTAIRRYTPQRLANEGYITPNKIRYYYPNKNPFSKIKFDYIKIKTKEGNGVLHIPFYGDYLPYNFLCDLFSYYSGFAWDLDIRQIGKSPRSNKDRKKVSYYVMNQYVTNQTDPETGQSAYNGYSTGWNWVFRGFTKWYNQFRSNYQNLDYQEREKIITNYLINKKWIPPPARTSLLEYGLKLNHKLNWDGENWDQRHDSKKWMNKNCGDKPVGDLT